jgi:hypothetical protein
LDLPLFSSRTLIAIPLGKLAFGPVIAKAVESVRFASLAAASRSRRATSLKRNLSPSPASLRY